jgi:hypothetical protein
MGFTAAVSPTSRAADASSADLLACAKLGDNLERLSCYDHLTERLSANPAHAPAPVSAAAPDMFGARPIKAPEEHAAPPAELKSITARVTSLHGNARTGAILDLDNGQKWQQVGTEDLMLEVGDSVKISRGAFSSFWLMTPGNRSTHVKRIL